MKKYIIASLIGAFALAGCSRNAITGRNQASLISESQLHEMAATQYRQFLSQNPVVGPSGAMSKEYAVVQRVGTRIASAITQYFTQQGLSEEVKGYNWEFNLVQGNDINAFCMPGGKVVIYTGLLPVAQNEAGLAVVMGHEIAHAILKHGSERMSRAMYAQYGGQIAGAVLGTQSQALGNIFSSIYSPVATTTVILPNSRAQESEADRYGLRFAAMAGYNPNEAIPFWTRMAQAGGQSSTPTILRSHPTNEQRIRDLQKIVPEAMKYYRPISN